MPVLATRNPTDKPFVKIRVHLYNKNVMGFKVSRTMLWSLSKRNTGDAPEDFLEATTLVGDGLGWRGWWEQTWSQFLCTSSRVQCVGTAEVGVVLGHWLCGVSL